MQVRIHFILCSLMLALPLMAQEASPETVTSQPETAAAASATPDVALIVDRNPRVQTLQVYENGVLTRTCPVSTGRETFDFNEGNYNQNPYCSFTTTNAEAGVEDFNVQRLTPRHVSNSWSARDAEGNITSEAVMDYSIFFNGGIAFHAVDVNSASGPRALSLLGPKDRPSNGGSGACVRLDPDCAQYAFNLVAQRDTSGAYTADPSQDPRNNAECRPAPGRTPPTRCTDDRQRPVLPRHSSPGNVQITVTDSRSQEEQRCARESCNSLKRAFLADKNICMATKANAQLSIHTGVSLAAPTAVPAERRNGFLSALFGRRQQPEPQAVVAAPTVQTVSDTESARRALPADVFRRINEECNREGHQKIKDGILRPTPCAAPATSPRPRPRPENLGGTPPSA